VSAYDFQIEEILREEEIEVAGNDDQVNPEYPAVISSVVYRDPKAALAWLERAFGFETAMLVEGEDGNDSQIHAEMDALGGPLFVGGQWSDRMRSPLEVGGSNTQFVRVRLDGGIDDHFARAREAGATVVEEPADQFYGDRTYRVLDPEGHMWVFFQKIRNMTLDEVADEGGVSIRMRS
jgi:uncharacterized glyoxalase superfamily protein PhnB